VQQIEVRLRLRRGEPAPDDGTSAQDGFHETVYSLPANQPDCLDPKQQALDVYEIVVPMQARDPQGRAASIRLGLSYAYDRRQSQWVLVALSLYDVPGDMAILAPAP